MPDPFFSSTARKRKRAGNNSTATGNKKKKTLKRQGSKPSGKEQEDGHADSSESEADVHDLDLRDDNDQDHHPHNDYDDDEYSQETPVEKRLRLAQLYLDSVKSDLADGEFDAAEIDKEIISSRLKQDILEHSGKLHLFVASSYDNHASSIDLKKGHRFSLTSLASSQNSKYVWTAGKEGAIVKWDLSTGKSVHKSFKQKEQGHQDIIFAMAISGDGKYLVSSGRDKKIIVWDVDTMSIVHVFQGALAHRDAVSALSFRKGTNQLYTASFDRTIKLYDLSPSVMGYIETLFGHQDSILSIDALAGETCVTVGGRDKTVRYWKIKDEAQLVFRGGGKSKLRDVIDGVRVDNNNDEKEKKKDRYIEGSLECVAMVDENTFLSGGDSGTISLWSTQKKKAVFTQPLCHGVQTTHSSTEGEILTPRWITSLATLPYSDLFASGSYDSQIRLWKISPSLKSFQPLLITIPTSGVINSLQFLTPPKKFWESAKWATTTTTDTDMVTDTSTSKTNPSRKQSTTVEGAKPLLLLAAIGQEHRLGRWINMKDEGAKNYCKVAALFPQTAQ